MLLRHSLSFQLSLAALAIAVLVVFPVAGYAVWAAAEVDRLASLREHRLIEQAVADERAKLSCEQKSVTTWDDSVEFARRGDQAWMAANLGEWMASFYGHDQVYVVDGGDRPVYAMVGGKTVGSERFAAGAPTFLPLLAELRRRLASGTPVAEVGASDLVSLDGSPAIVSLSPIIPSTESIVVAPGAQYFHISVRRFDPPLLASLGERQVIAGLDVVAPASPAMDGDGVQLAADNGTIVGRLVWNRDTPGTTIVERTLPSVIAMAVVFAGLLIIMLLRLRKAAAELVASREEAEHLALHDTLTGLPNRALFNDRLACALLFQSGSQPTVALHFFDLDRFKHVNDTLGHPAGDLVLRQVGERIRALLRETDMAARLGGDEFAVVQTGVVDQRDAEDLAGRIVAAIGTPFRIFGEEVLVGASVGIAMGGALQEPNELIRRADVALYDAKGNGKGRYRVFEPFSAISSTAAARQERPTRNPTLHLTPAG